MNKFFLLYKRISIICKWKYIKIKVRIKIKTKIKVKAQINKWSSESISSYLETTKLFLLCYCYPSLSILGGKTTILTTFSNYIFFFNLCMTLLRSNYLTKWHSLWLLYILNICRNLELSNGAALHNKTPVEDALLSCSQSHGIWL